MRQAVPQSSQTSSFMTLFSKAIGYVLFSATAIVAVIMALSFYSYHPEDPAWSNAKNNPEVIHNIAGEQGAYFADIMFSAIGNAVWLLPFLVIGFGYQLFVNRKILTISLELISYRLLGVLLTIFSLSTLLDLQNNSGGIMGSFIGTELVNVIANAANSDPAIMIYIMKIIFAILTFVGLRFVTGLGPISWADHCGKVILKLYRLIFPNDTDAFIEPKKQLPSHDGNIEQDTINRMLQEDQRAPRKTPGFFGKMFGSKDDEHHTPRPPEFIEIDEKLLAEDEYEANAPIQDPTYNSYQYNPLEAEDSESIDEPSNTEDDMNNKNKNNNTIPPIFRNLQKTEPEEIIEEKQQSASDDLKIDALTPELNESWDNFIRSPKATDAPIASDEADEPESEEKKSIPSIFKNLFKARRKKREVTAETIDKIEPAIAPIANIAEPALTTATMTPSFEKANVAPTHQHMQNDNLDGTADTITTQVQHESSELQFSISDDFADEAIESFEYLPNEIAEIETAEKSAIDHNAPYDPELADDTPIAEIDTETPVAQVTSTPTTEKFIGHEIDPRSGMPIPVKATKEYPMAGRVPGLDLLGNPPPVTESYDEEELAELASLIEEQFKNFNIEVTVVNVEPGPIITRFELDLAPGVKISQINNLNKDIARALSVTSVRIVEIIPGKPYIGLEIPNKKRQIVYFKEGLYADDYRNSKHPLSIVLGKDVAGEHVVANLMKMPHLLIAGTTGSGKSVGINTILLSLLYKAHPDDLRLILIDPKMLELSVYDNIPHLLAPVVTDMKESANALRWAVMEMERRFLLMSKLRVRNIDGYNQKVREANHAGTPILDPLWDAAKEVSNHTTAPALTTLPYIVIVIDELADMMMTVGKAVEELIARLTQKARAAGIHLVVATQRPSVDVITGLIKSNIPSRIAFQVSSKIDSRTILDQQGAENLLGHGDMLFFPTGAPFPLRVHGSFVSDDEVNRVTDFLRLTGPTNYVEDMLKDPQEEIPGLSETASGFVPNPDDVEDVLYDEAVKIVLEDKRPTISYVQRKLRIGYQRAARLIEAMEEQGIVSAPGNNGNREILVHYDG